MTNLAQMLTDTVEAHGERTAIKLDDLRLSYEVLDQGVARSAGMLAAEGVEPGDRVGIMLPNVPYFPFVFYGALRLGAVVVPMNPLLKGREVAFHLSDSGAKLLVAWHQFAAPAQEGAEEAGAGSILVEPGGFEQRLGAADPVAGVADREDDDTALILYTSGTTGTPKGAELTHANLRAATQISVDLVGADADGVSFGGLPLFHVFGLTSGLNSAVRVGGCLTLLPRFDPAKAIDVIQRDRVTTFLGVPTMYSAHPQRPGARVVRPVGARALRLGRGRDAGGGPARLRGRVRLQGPGGLRAVGDDGDRVVQPPGPRAQGGHDRHPRRRHGDEGRRRGRGRGPAGRGRRDRPPRPGRHEGLLEPARGDRRRLRRGRLLPHRRPRDGGSRRLLLRSSTARRR